MLSLRRFTLEQAVTHCLNKYGNADCAEQALADWLDALPRGKPMPATVDFIEAVWSELRFLARQEAMTS